MEDNEEENKSGLFVFILCALVFIFFTIKEPIKETFTCEGLSCTIEKKYLFAKPVVQNVQKPQRVWQRRSTNRNYSAKLEPIFETSYYNPLAIDRDENIIETRESFKIDKYSTNNVFYSLLAIITLFLVFHKKRKAS